MIPVQIKALQYIPNASRGLCDGLGLPYQTPSLALLTTDSDDVTYIALDEATKAADVQVCYAKSFYAGAANASTPNAGEVIGILCAATPGAAKSGMEAAISAIQKIGFDMVQDVPFLAHTISSCGRFLSTEAGVPIGSALAYLIAPPLESMVGLDAALKASDVRLCKLYAPPSETNFGGGLLTGTQSACIAACDAFREAVSKVARNPTGPYKERNYGF